MEGCLTHQFDTIMNFLTRNLRTIQIEQEFNSLGELEIPRIALVEFVVNALVHRSLNWNTPIRIFIFDNRIEIHSPGSLPNGLTVDDITKGTSMPRNLFLFTNANYLLPYTGAGSGIVRALEENLDVAFENDEKTHDFLITIQRKQNQTQHQGEQTEHRVEQTEHQVGQNEHQVKHQAEHQVTKLTAVQKDIVNYCSVPRTAQEILDKIGVYNQSRARKRYIQPLVELGVIEMTNPDKPNTKNQKYRKVKKENKHF